MTIPIRVSSLVRALGPTVAAVLPPSTPARTVLRAAALGITDVAARRIDPRGISVVMVTPDDGKTYTAAQHFGSQAVTTGSWVGVCLLKGLVTDRLPIPRPVTALATGVAVYVLDTVSAEMHDGLIRKAEEAKRKAQETIVET
jgi:hypothetical protein